MAKIRELKKNKRKFKITLSEEEAARLMLVLNKGCVWDESGKVGDLCLQIHEDLFQLDVSGSEEEIVTA
jgi:hypothetical protein